MTVNTVWQHRKWTEHELAAGSDALNEDGQTDNVID